MSEVHVGALMTIHDNLHGPDVGECRNYLSGSIQRHDADRTIMADVCMACDARVDAGTPS